MCGYSDTFDGMEVSLMQDFAVILFLILLILIYIKK